MPKTFELLKPEIEELLADRKWAELRELLVEIPEPDISDTLEQLGERDRIVLLRLLPREMLSEVFSYLSDRTQTDLLRALTEEETRVILAGLSPDDRTEFLQELPGQAIQKMLNLLTPEDRRETLQLLGYPEESVGRLMTPDYVAVRPEWTVDEALAHVRIKGKDSETINVVYVTDARWKLVGVLGLRKLILTPPSERIGVIMEESVVRISAFEDREKAVQLISRYDITVLPVVDANDILLGIVTIDDLFDVAEEEATEDFQKSAAVHPLKASYRESSVLSLYRKRVTWLASLLGISVVTTGILSAQADTLGSAIALAFFIPLLIGTGGNTGNQSATLMIRAMAMEWVIRKGGIALFVGTEPVIPGVRVLEGPTALVPEVRKLAGLHTEG